MKLFIDSNSYLAFYFFSSDSLEELLKLAGLLKTKELELILPQQVIDEVKRNREGKINESIKHLSQKIKMESIPRIFEDYDETTELRESLKRMLELKNIILEKIKDDVKNKILKADLTISEIFTNANIESRTEEILEEVKNRTDIGNPPGKKGSLGDAIIWETILNVVDHGEDIYFVSKDSDFRSIIDPSRLNSFLEKEFTDKKHAQIYFYDDLASLLNEKFPNIKIETIKNIESDYYIGQLAISQSFFNTHHIINNLYKFYAFNKEQLNNIVFAYISNDQVYQIIDDGDIRGFIEKVISNREDEINEDLLDKLYVLLGRFDYHEEGCPF